MKICAYCGEPCEGWARGGTDREGNELWFHHGESDGWDIDPPEPSCYERAQWQTEEEDSLLDYLMRPKEKDDLAVD